MTTPLETTPFDSAGMLTDEESRLECLRQFSASGDPGDIAQGLGAVARATGMSQIASAADALPCPGRGRGPRSGDGGTGARHLGLRPSMDRAGP
ncbi:hypothetical protein ACFQS7_17320 [Dankookia sp. GCM10030260]|uniref:hypothetical protein n=1 Tax=Dankookia sp. GCM10030260 TaxID=3273390 RepID=UPI0036062823